MALTAWAVPSKHEAPRWHPDVRLFQDRQHGQQEDGATFTTADGTAMLRTFTPVAKDDPEYDKFHSADIYDLP